MPTIASTSSLRIPADDFSLSVQLTHTVVVDAPSDVLHRSRRPLPDALDIRATSDLVFSFSAATHRQPVPPHILFSSALTASFRRHLQANAAALGLDQVSTLYADERTGIPKLSLTPSSPPASARSRLLSIHFAYVWKPEVHEQPSYGSPFSAQPFLPVQGALDSAVQKIMANHLVRRYPLIFGPWRKKLDLETQLFPSLCSSILRPASRSPDSSFRRKCTHLLATLRRQNASADDARQGILRQFLSTLTPGGLDLENDPLPTETDISDDSTLNNALERCLRAGVPSIRFKASSLITTAGQERDDDDDPTFMLPPSASPAASDCSHMDLDDSEPCKASDDLTALYDTDYSSDDLLLDCEPSATDKDLCFDDQVDHPCTIEDDAYMHSPAHTSYSLDEDTIDAQAAGEGSSADPDNFDLSFDDCGAWSPEHQLGSSPDDCGVWPPEHQLHSDGIKEHVVPDLHNTAPNTPPVIESFQSYSSATFPAVFQVEEEPDDYMDHDEPEADDDEAISQSIVPCSVSRVRKDLHFHVEDTSDEDAWPDEGLNELW